MWSVRRIERAKKPRRGVSGWFAPLSKVTIIDDLGADRQQDRLPGAGTLEYIEGEKTRLVSGDWRLPTQNEY